MVGTHISALWSVCNAVRAVLLLVSCRFHGGLLLPSIARTNVVYGLPMVYGVLVFGHILVLMSVHLVFGVLI